MLVGTAAVDDLAATAATMASFDAGPLELRHAEVLQAVFEMGLPARQAVLPPALHPTTPPIMVVLAWRCPDSRWGPFAMAQVRVGCRSGVRPRGFVAGCVASSQRAAAGLASDFGFPAVAGNVELVRHYDRTDLEVRVGGSSILDLSGMDPDPLGLDDVQYTVTMNLAHTPRGVRLVQVEPEYVASRLERLRPSLARFDPSGWGQPLLAPSSPVAATVALAAITVPALRYVCRADLLAFEGTEPVR